MGVYHYGKILKIVKNYPKKQIFLTKPEKDSIFVNVRNNKSI